MRPTIDEQLAGTCRILENVVAPALPDGYAADILRGLTSNLRMLSAALPQLPAFLRWDIAGNEALLQELMEGVPSALSVAIDKELAAAPPDPIDLSELEARNDRLRALLAQAVRSDELGSEHRERIMKHLAERAARHPIRFAIAIPQASSTPAS